MINQLSVLYRAEEDTAIYELCLNYNSPGVVIFGTDKVLINAILRYKLTRI